MAVRIHNSMPGTWFVRALLCAILVLLLTGGAHAESAANALAGSEADHAAGHGSGAAAGTVPFTNSSSSRTLPDTQLKSADGDGATPAHSATAAERIPDWSGIGRDTAVIFGAQAGAAAVTYIMPESFSGWSDQQKRDGLKKYARNFVEPVFDKDKFYVNYLLHPYWGSAYYTRGRERGLNQTQSFAYATLMSAMYEFGTECFAERPSIQDLIVTPVVGSLLGAYIFEPWRDSIKSKPELRWYDHAFLVATDPLGVLSLGFEKLFGIKSTIIVNYSPSPLRTTSPETTLASNSSRVEVALRFPLN